MELRRNEKITFRCTELEKDALAEQATRCSLSVSEYCRSLSLGGRPRERYTEEERQLLRDIAQLKGTLQRLNNYFGGRQYEVINEGNTGTYAKATDQVQCHYEGTLIDGTLFDSSIKRGQPATFGVSQVIPGWVEALQLMPEGAKWKLYIPSELAYGAQGAGEMIPPHSTLIFEVELLKVLNK